MAYAIPTVTRLLAESLVKEREAQSRVEDCIERLCSLREKGYITQEQLDDALRTAYAKADEQARDEPQEVPV